MKPAHLVSRTLAAIALGVSQPAHFHEGGCAHLSPDLKYPLVGVVDGYSVTDVPMPIETLLASHLGLNVHESVTKLGRAVACGDISAK